MAVHTIRIDSSAEWSVIEIQSAGIWARSPGQAISFTVTDLTAAHCKLEIEDRVVRLSNAPGMSGVVSLQLQLATTDNAVTLRLRKSDLGTLRVVSVADDQLNDLCGKFENALIVVLYVELNAARAVGIDGGDVSLTM